MTQVQPQKNSLNTFYASNPFAVTQLMGAACASNPEAIAVRHNGRTTSWTELSKKVSLWASVLHSLGLNPGDRVAVLAANSDYFFTLLLAIPWAGGTLVPLNTRLANRELSACLQDSESRFILYDKGHEKIASELATKTPNIQAILSIDADNKTHTSLAFLEQNVEPIPDQGNCGEDIAVLCYTSGTTGQAKGVMLSHRSLVTGALQWQTATQLNASDSLLIVVPLFHLAGLSNSFGALLVAGTAEIVAGFDPAHLAATIEREKISYAVLVPTMIKALVEHPATTTLNLTSLQKITYGGSPISQVNLKKALLRLPTTKFIQIYGQTETGITSALMPEFHHPSSNKLHSAGRPVAAVNLCIMDIDDNVSKSGSWGEICVRSPGLANGYWNRPVESAQTYREGWLHTGDIGYLDEAGFLYIVDRVKDMIISGGENIYSAEVESVLEQHPAVAECAVIGISSERWGETVHAVVCVINNHSTTEQALIAYCRQLLAGYKCPSSIQFRKTPLPRNPLGKVLKRDLREHNHSIAE